MKTLFHNLRSTWQALLPSTLLGATIAIVGCAPKHHYEISLAPNEAVGADSECRFTDGTAAGRVVKVEAATGAYADRIATIVVPDEAALRFRQGIVRVRDTAAVLFDTSRCRPDSPPLPTGARIATETKVQATAKNLVMRKEVWGLAAVALAGLIFALCRRLRIALAMVIIALALFLLSTTLGNAQTPGPPVARSGVLFSRDFFRQEQSLVQHYIAEAERSADAASRSLDARLPHEAGEELVRCLCRLDSTDLILQDEPSRILQLKSAPLAYSKGEEQRRLTAECEALRRQLQDLQHRAGGLLARCITNQPEASPLQVFLARRENFRARARTGDNDPAGIVEECRRLAAVSKTETELARLRQQADAQLAQVLRTPVAPTVLTQVVTVTRTNVLQVVSPSLPPVTNTQYVTNIQRILVDRVVERLITNVVTNVVLVTNAPINIGLMTPSGPADTSSQKLRRPSATPTAPGSTTLQAPANPRSAQPQDIPSAQAKTWVAAREAKVPIFLFAVAALTTVVVFVIVSALRNRVAEVMLFEEASGSEVAIRLSTPEDCVLLDAQPRPVPLSARGTGSTITRNWRGRALFLPGPDGALINGTTPRRPVLLKAQDHITLGTPSGARWEFRGISHPEAQFHSSPVTTEIS